MRADEPDLFTAVDALPTGFRYQAEFITPDIEAALIEEIAALPLEAARYRSFTARRRIVSFGFEYDFDSFALKPKPGIPEFLLPLRARAAAWVELPAEDFVHSLINEYRPGTPLGWHRDAPNFGTVVGISLAAWCRMRLRPHGSTKSAIALDIAPRSIYAFQHDARWRWQHAVSPTKALRYSITFRTLVRAEGS